MERKIKNINANECQFSSLKGIAEGNAAVPPQSLLRKLKLFIRRHLTAKQDRKLHIYANNIIRLFHASDDKNNTVNNLGYIEQAQNFQSGDLVRVRSKEEIELTLNHIGQLKGCSFMDVMTPYCGTIQRVFKPMERFVDERDLTVKRCSGLVLLAGVMCQGTTQFGRCDRSCLMFWRQEWLEKIE
ncbi:MAG: hypothetical protein AB9883_00605 [Acidaminococcaceae bacterium]